MMKNNPHSALKGNKKEEVETENNPHLEPLLRKLRPFQREAYDFATLGKISDRHLNKSPKEAPHSSSSKSSSSKRVPTRAPTPVPSAEENSFEYHPKYLGKGRVLVADEMGLGKSATSLAIMTRYLDEWPLLIFCPASLRHTWPGEIEKFLPTLSPNEIYVVQGFDDTDWIKKRKHLKIVIATYSLLQTRSAVAHIINDFGFQAIIADESHNLKERTSQRCKLAMPILQKAKRLVLLSGTPALARPVELWSQVQCLAPDLFGGYTAYTKQYCNARRGRFGWDVSGLSNAEELHSKLRQVMVRRLKADVLKELPPKQRSIVPIKLDKAQEGISRELMEELKETRMSVSELMGRDAESADFEARRLLMMAYQQSGISKASSVANYLIDWLDGSGTQKILVFGHHKQVLDALEQAVAKKLKGVGHIRIDGSVDSKERAVRVKKFQTNARTRVAILSMTAAGVGLTLTAASSVLFAELHWTPGVLAQAEDRCHRIGQASAVNVMYCVCKDPELSVDMSLWGMLGRKVGTLGRVIDGCRNASLQAKDAAGNPSTNTGAGESVEEGLTRFFAETAEGTTKAAKAAPPVKGSIMSFFRPTKSKHDEPEIETSSSPGLALIPASSSTNPSTRAVLPPLSRPQAVPQKRSDPIEWACEACTFLNSKIPLTSNSSLTCDMCGSLYAGVPGKEKDGPNRRPVTPKEKEVIVLDDLKPQAKSDDEIIVLDDDGDDGCFNQASPKSGPNNLVTIDDDNGTTCSVVTPAKSKVSCMLQFSVSKNSGRVTIHHGVTGLRYPYNFDIEQAITDETSDRLLEREISRNSKTHSGCLKIDFNREGIAELLSPVMKELQSRGTLYKNNGIDEKKCREEVEEFITNYFGLREVEKKVLKDSGMSFPSKNLKQAAARLMTSTVTQSTERYAGGAKERARENLENGTATERDTEVLDGRACAWCAGDLSHAAQRRGVESTYCSQKCAEHGRLQRGGMYSSTQVRAQVFGLEGGVCRKCGIDAHSLYTRICSLSPPERLNALINAKFTLPKSGAALEKLLQNPKEGDFWQADHIVAVAEGGGGCGLDNLQTLCTPCHQDETTKLRARLRLGPKPDDSSDGKRKQVDIRAAFFGASKKVKK